MEEDKRPLTERDRKILNEVRKVQKLRREQGCRLVDCGVVINNTNLRIEIIDLKRKIREQEKIIELMAKDIAENKLDEDICSKVRSPEKEECDCYADVYDACYGCVIEYYEKKAKGE